jgi:LytS/YehU family sensor histidine kinase
MEDQHKAVDFVSELLSVYRYLLQANERNMMPLRSELHFIDHYFHLLKTRFGDAIELRKQIDDKYMDYVLPPLTLQLLVENAVKHNPILPQKPLILTCIPMPPTA